MLTVDLTAIDSLDIPQEEKSRIKAQLMAQSQSEAASFSKEFARYKQDCRKRALDLAHQQVLHPIFKNFIESNEFVNSSSGEKVETPKPEVQDILIMAIADKYYNWLISLP